MADYKKITIFDKHLESPFLGDLLEIDVSTRRKILAGQNPNLVVNGDTGEVSGVQLFAIYEKVDKEQFTKIYQKGITQMFNLSKSGIKVFGFLTTIAKPNKGEVYFQIDKCKEYTGYKTDKPILKGLSELLENEFIARTKHHYKYFINPTMFFNGSRVAFIKMYQADSTLEID